MSEEEKKAVEYYQDKDVSFSVDFDTEKLLKTLGITEEDSFKNHQIRFKTLLNLITKLQKENEELKDRIREHTMLISPYYVKRNYISVQKVKDEIEELKRLREKTFGLNNTLVKSQIEILQELLERRK